MPAITIITTAYNTSSFLPVTLDSILSQTFEDWECIVIDDGSKDNTVEIARSYAEKDSRFQVLEQTNSGPAVARNYAFARSNPDSPYITFMDSDDIWLPEALQLLHEEIERRPQAAGVHALADFIDAQGKPLRPGEFAEMGRQRREVRGKRMVRLELHEPTRFAGLCNTNVLFPPGLCLMHRKVYEKSGGFDPRQERASDWDVLINISRYGDIHFLNRIILFYRRHESNLGASDLAPLFAYRVRCKAFYSSKNTPAQRQIVRNGWRAYQAETIGERIAKSRSLLAQRQYRKALMTLARVPISIWRFMVGKPSLRSLTPEMRHAIGE